MCKMRWDDGRADYINVGLNVVGYQKLSCVAFAIMDFDQFCNSVESVLYYLV